MNESAGKEKNKSTRPNILIVAYGCEPDKGSEQGVGWNWALQIARFADVTVITRANNRSSIEAKKLKDGFSNPKFVYYDPPKIILRLKRKHQGLYAFYTAWQWGSYRLARRLHEKNSYTHVMQLTFGSIWMPVFVHRLNTKFIWGPIGGGEGIPKNLTGFVTRRAQIIQLVRNALIATLPFNPLIAPVLTRAEKLLVRTSDTLDILPASTRSKAHCILETGVHNDVFMRLGPSKERASESDPILLYTGRLVGFKNVEMLLHAAVLARAKGTSFRIRLIGDGRERDKLEKLSTKLGISELVDFVGEVSHERVLAELQNASIYVFPSLREAGTWSLMEAMCAGLPVICLDTSAMSIITDEECAIRITPTSREAIIKGFAEAIGSLCASPALRDSLGRAGQNRMREAFLWNRKGDDVARLIFGDDVCSTEPLL